MIHYKDFIDLNIDLGEYIIMLGFPAAYAYNLYSGILRSVGKVNVALFILLIATLTNFGLDIYFVRNLQMGIRGAALATVIAQLLSAFLCFIYLYIDMASLVFKREDCF